MGLCNVYANPDRLPTFVWEALGSHRSDGQYFYIDGHDVHHSDATAFRRSCTLVFSFLPQALRSVVPHRCACVSCPGLCDSSTDLSHRLPKTITWLILARAIAGVGGGGIVSLVWTITSEIVDVRNQAKWSQALSLTWACSAVAGPLLGGVFSGE